MMENKKNIKRLLSWEKGFAALYIAIIVLIIMAGIALSLTFLVVNQQKILSNSLKSYQSFSAAEAGIEDALLRLKKNMNWSSPYNLTLGGGASTVEISSIVGGTRTITSTGNINSRIRKVRVVYQISSNQISFYYGAQVGEGGMIMGNGSKVQGNVFSNGSVTGGGTIVNNITVAGNVNKIQGIEVGGDARVHTCDDSKITGTLHYVDPGGSCGDCIGVCVPRVPSGPIDPIPLPITQSQVNNWKAVATAGGIIIPPTGIKTINGVESLGPVEIQGNLTVNSGKTLKLTGTIYVTGNIIFNNSAIVSLDSSYGSLSGIIIAGGTIMVENGTQISGSGQPGSYTLVLSIKNDIANPVINVRNNASGAIFYANDGLIFLKNNMKAREVTAKKIQIENNAIIEYESGLENANFTSGPGGSWEVASWKEIE